MALKTCIAKRVLAAQLPRRHRELHANVASKKFLRFDEDLLRNQDLVLVCGSNLTTPLVAKGFHVLACSLSERHSKSCSRTVVKRESTADYNSLYGRSQMCLWANKINGLWARFVNMWNPHPPDKRVKVCLALPSHGSGTSIPVLAGFPVISVLQFTFCRT